MEGYCGRAVPAGEAAVTGPVPAAGPDAVLRRPRGRVMRMGPRPLSCEPPRGAPARDGFESAAAA